MYQRKTKNAKELSAALSRAAKSRKTFRGGRPLGWRKCPDDPTATLSVRARDKQILTGFARAKGCTVVDALHTLAAVIVFGGSLRRRPELAPPGWSFNGRRVESANKDADIQQPQQPSS